MIRSVVVTGANSMVGIHTIWALLKKDVKVLAITRTISKELRAIPKGDNFKILQCDLSKVYEKGRAITEKYDAFIHLAWGGTSGNNRNDEQLQVSNYKYALDCVKLAAILDCKIFLGVGSQAEYGKVNHTVKYDTPERPYTPYGIAKYVSLYQTRKLACELGMEHIWVRLFSVYGPCNTPNSVVMKSIDTFSNEKSMKYNTTGEQVWNFLYAQDAADGILLALEKGTDNSVYCIANTENKKLKEYMYRIRDIVNPNISLEFARENSSSVVSLEVDVSREKKELGFVPKVSFDEGIRKTIDWYKESKK